MHTQQHSHIDGFSKMIREDSENRAKEHSTLQVEAAQQRQRAEVAEFNEALLRGHQLKLRLDAGHVARVDAQQVEIFDPVLIQVSRVEAVRERSVDGKRVAFAEVTGAADGSTYSTEVEIARLRQQSLTDAAVMLQIYQHVQAQIELMCA